MTKYFENSGKIANKICAAICILAVVFLVGFLIFGIFDQDLASWTVVGALASAPFVDLAVLVSYWAERRMRLVSGAMWLITASVMLITTLMLLTAGKSDGDLLLTYGTAILAFPLGLIAGPITGQLSMSAGLMQTIVIWVLTIGAGSLQWFVLIPGLLKARAMERDISR